MTAEFPLSMLVDGRRHLRLIVEERDTYDDPLTPKDRTYDRPKTRGDCADVPRPCPFVACKHNLYLDVGQGRDSQWNRVYVRNPKLRPHEVDPENSCALDIADRGALTLRDTAKVMHLVHGRIVQFEQAALVALSRVPALQEMARGGGFEGETDDGTTYAPGGDE